MSAHKPRRAVLLAALAGTLAAPLCLVEVATSSAQEVPTADLAIVSSTANVSHAKVEQSVTFTVVATNNGPDAVGEIDVNVPDERSTSLTYDLICDGEGGPFGPDGRFCEFTGPIQPGQTVTTTIVGEVQTTGAKRAGITACVLSFAGPFNDPDSSNDCAAATVRIVGKRT
jgi:uncharacterized repeat protein (TIGR01451 family)